MKNYLTFVDAIKHELISEYDTDSEPPRVGDLFQPYMMITDEKISD
jgi:hypothetical protein